MHNTNETAVLPDWIAFLGELLPSQGDWSEEEYLVLTDHRRRLVEFTDGFLEALPMPTDEHQAILGMLYNCFQSYFAVRGGVVRFAPLRMRVRPGKYREPDLLALLDAKDSRRQQRFWTGADLALEVVSEDNPDRDLVDKRKDYAEAGVREYWIVNPLNKSVTVLTLGDTGFAEVGKFGAGDSAASALLPEFSIRVSAVFEAE
jgi:Uma2 family endonuclease